MPVTAEDLCAFLLDLDAPDRLERPLLLDQESLRVGVARLVDALGEITGGRCVVEALPEDHEHYGTITVPTPEGSVFTLAVGRYGLIVAYDLDDDESHLAVMAKEGEFGRIGKVVFAAGFSLSAPMSALTPGRARRPRPRLFSARTAGELVRQIRSLADGEGAAAELGRWLCETLDVPAGGASAERVASLDVLTPEQVLAEVERVRACVGVLATPPGSDERRWSAIDDTILDRGMVLAIKAFRNEFGGGLREAIESVNDRVDLLRRSRPHGYLAGRARAA